MISCSTSSNNCLLLLLCCISYYFRFELDVDECAISPCLSGGTCLERVNGLGSCVLGFRGTQCQISFTVLKFRGEVAFSIPKENVAQFAQVKELICYRNTTGTSMEYNLFIFWNTCKASTALSCCLEPWEAVFKLCH